MRGFTLIELIVVIAIMGLVSGVIFWGVRAGEESLLLDRTARLLAQDIRKAMDLALQAESFDDCPSGSISAYAIHFQNETYDIGDDPDEKDIDGTTSYLLYAACDGSFKYDKNDDANLELVQFERGIEIKQLRKAGGDNSTLDVAFEPPDPLVLFEPNEPPFTVILAPKDAAIIGYEYLKTGVVTGWVNHPSTALKMPCDATNPNLECTSSVYPASGADPSNRYDWYCTLVSCGGPQRRSAVFTKLPLYSPSKVITVTSKGVIEVQ